MKKRPILFSAPMVRGILAGTKTQTRRVVKPQPTGFVGGPGVTLCDGSPAPLAPMNDFSGVGGQEIICRYGQPGDRLWVRETWSDECDPHWVMYRADHRAERRSGGELFDACDADELRTLHTWKPSIHMPRWASRITLEVTGVRVERVQDITEADAMAEGIVECPIPADDEGPRRIGYMVGPDDGKSGLTATAREAFRGLWESINGPCSWDENPWVWVVEFKRLEGGAA